MKMIMYATISIKSISIYVKAKSKRSPGYCSAYIAYWKAACQLLHCWMKVQCVTSQPIFRSAFHAIPVPAPCIEVIFAICYQAVCVWRREHKAEIARLYNLYPWEPHVAAATSPAHLLEWLPNTATIPPEKVPTTFQSSNGSKIGYDIKDFSNSNTKAYFW